MWALHNWIKESFRTNRPFDEFVRELVVAKGSIYSNGPANYFRINRTSEDLAESTAQLFLGVRLGCAKCHHHPFEKYSQGDYYGFAAFFSRVGTKNSEDFGLFGSCSKSALLFIGSGMDKPMVHNPDYDFPDELIPVGAGLFLGVLDQLLGFAQPAGR